MKQCPTCGHKTDKDVCPVCGTATVTQQNDPNEKVQRTIQYQRFDPSKAPGATAGGRAISTGNRYVQKDPGAVHRMQPLTDSSKPVVNRPAAANRNISNAAEQPCTAAAKQQQTQPQQPAANQQPANQQYAERQTAEQLPTNQKPAEQQPLQRPAAKSQSATYQRPDEFRPSTLPRRSKKYRQKYAVYTSNPIAANTPDETAAAAPQETRPQSTYALQQEALPQSTDAAAQEIQPQNIDDLTAEQAQTPQKEEAAQSDQAAPHDLLSPDELEKFLDSQPDNIEEDADASPEENEIAGDIDNAGTAGNTAEPAEGGDPADNPEVPDGELAEDSIKPEEELEETTDKPEISSEMPDTNSENRPEEPGDDPAGDPEEPGGDSAGDPEVPSGELSEEPESTDFDSENNPEDKADDKSAEAEDIPKDDTEDINSETEITGGGSDDGSDGNPTDDSTDNPDGNQEEHLPTRQELIRKQNEQVRRENNRRYAREHASRAARRWQKESEQEPFAIVCGTCYYSTLESETTVRGNFSKKRYKDDPLPQNEPVVSYEESEWYQGFETADDPWGDYVEDNAKKDGISHKSWFIILMLIIIWPIGLILMWVRRKFPVVVRIIITLLIAAVLLFEGYFLCTYGPALYEQYLYGDTNNTTYETSSGNDSSSEDASQNAAATETQQQALDKANEYVDTLALSREGLIKQLKHDGYTADDAAYAADNCSTSWNKEAKEMAEQYMDATTFTYDEMVEQLESEGFTKKQAKFGANAVGLE